MSPLPRLGPRPLALHLTMQALTAMAWPAGLMPWNAGSRFWKQPWADSWPDAALPPEAAPFFFNATTREAAGRLDAFLAGVEAYHAHPYRRPLNDPAPVWAAGTTVLRDYAPDAAPSARPVLLVPSLINRAQILDLAPRRSLCRHLADHGLHPFLIDWGPLGPEEATFTIEDYVLRRLEPALDAIALRCARRPAVLGYCMGGLLALALASRRPAEVAGLVLLATPWDFAASDPTLRALILGLAPLGHAALAHGTSRTGVPGDVVQVPFVLMDPSGVARRYAAFGRLDPRSSRARDFVAVEDWLNDAVALAGPTALEALERWYGANEPARGLWRVGGRLVDPARLRLPALVAWAEHDRIVPPASAAALASALPGARVRVLPLGHVGLMVGRQAPTRVYRPVRAWLDHLP
ncbi:alpha/beta fold hydrolase [Pararhodospirillum oryzae]|uniref:Alpha/beta hydrolase n=1 Tax=Pararhodospirillum oryzae TaxID=478448 RepID=A0A512H8X4_9PROT|nr:alpha/beta fold hydrolase [Pararhodospirillum oryzae]GEO81905.1 alpha/beta hydrolase [Pararhodospirillum oryzae]